MTKKRRSQEPETAFCRDLFTFYLFSFPNDWTNGLPPHSLPEDSIVANTVEVGFHSQMPDAAEQAQKKARMEES